MADRNHTYNYLDSRFFSSEYNHRKEDGTMLKGETKMVWDDNFIELAMKLPIGMPDHRYLGIMQYLLEQFVDISKYESDKEAYWQKVDEQDAIDNAALYEQQKKMEEAANAN